MLFPSLTQYFNSIKVRLKLPVPQAGMCRGCNFNSIKVRLKRSVGTDEEASTTFQFHKGTIKTRGLAEVA